MRIGGCVVFVWPTPTPSAWLRVRTQSACGCTLHYRRHKGLPCPADCHRAWLLTWLYVHLSRAASAPASRTNFAALINPPRSTLLPIRSGKKSIKPCGLRLAAMPWRLNVSSFTGFASSFKRSLNTMPSHLTALLLLNQRTAKREPIPPCCRLGSHIGHSTVHCCFGMPTYRSTPLHIPQIFG